MHARTRAAVYCCLYYNRGSNNSLSVNYFYSLVFAFTYLSLSVGVGYGLKLEYSVVLNGSLNTHLTIVIIILIDNFFIQYNIISYYRPEHSIWEMSKTS